MWMAAKFGNVPASNLGSFPTTLVADQPAAWLARQAVHQRTVVVERSTRVAKTTL
jgi:hypothetical protein